MHALVITLKFTDITPSTTAQIEALASDMAAIDGLLSTYWLRGSSQVTLVQTFESHAALDAYLASRRFAALSRIPGCQDVFAAHYDVATHLNALSDLREVASARDLIPV
jgi:quinol monooxygenase YgiN